MNERFRGQIGHPDGLNFDKCHRAGSTLVATCPDHGERSIKPDPEAHRAIWLRRLPLLLGEGKLVCGVCRRPFSALRVESAMDGLRERTVLGRWER